MQNNKDIIVLGVCTYNRPAMLEKCLQSLVSQEIPVNCKVLFCVIDNNSDKAHKVNQLVSKILQEHNHRYIFVEKRGLSFARNAVIDYALTTQADYIQFIDDDEHAEKGLIINLYNKIKSSGADVVQGNIVFNFPAGTPILFKNTWQINITEDTKLKYVATGNVIFSKKLFADWKLRFDERLSLIGGEDIDYFLRSDSKGGKHIFTNTATIYEEVPIERTSLKWQLVLRMRNGYTICYVMYLNRGMLYVIRKYIIKSIKNIFTAPCYIICGILFSKEEIKFKGLQRLYHAFGCLAFIIGIKINGYRKVTGH